MWSFWNFLVFCINLLRQRKEKVISMDKYNSKRIRSFVSLWRVHSSFKPPSTITSCSCRADIVPDLSRLRLSPNPSGTAPVCWAKVLTLLWCLESSCSISQFLHIFTLSWFGWESPFLRSWNPDVSSSTINGWVEISWCYAGFVHQMLCCMFFGSFWLNTPHKIGVESMFSLVRSSFLCGIQVVCSIFNVQ